MRAGARQNEPVAHPEPNRVGFRNIVTGAGANGGLWRRLQFPPSNTLLDPRPNNVTMFHTVEGSGA